MELLSILHHQICVSFDHIFSVPWWILTKLDLLALRLDDHKEDAWLNAVTYLNQLLGAMGDHERGKEYVNLLHDCNWDDLVLRVISPEVERTKNAEEEVLEKALFEIGHPLEVGRTDLKTNCFLSDLTV